LSVTGEALNRFGSGDAEIQNIKLLDDKDREIDFCKYGDDVKIVYEVLFKKEVEEPIFGIRITDFKGNIVYGTNTRLNNIKTGIFKKGDLIKVIFSQKMSLIGGGYSVSPAVGYNDNKTYCDWINDMLTINVIHRDVAEGLADLNSIISIEK